MQIEYVVPTPIPVQLPPKELDPSTDAERDRIVQFISRMPVPVGWGPQERAVCSRQLARICERLRNNAHRA